MEYVLQTKHLTKAFHGQKAIDDVSIHVRKGDIYGFIGQNGAGKTTLMRMVAGLAAPTEGEISLFGKKDLGRERSRIGCIIEYPGLYTGMTASQNLEIFRIAYGLPGKVAGEELLKTVGLSDTGKKKVKNFSLGMKQRLGIAIALLGNPDFLILDEPINGLDPEGIKEIRDLMLKLNKEREITILISSHILGELSKIATCYGIIQKGVLLEEIKKEELDIKCKRCLKIEVDDTNKVARVLEEQLQIYNYDILGSSSIRIFDRFNESGLINQTLVQAGIFLISSTIVGENLEEYFMSRMGGKEVE